MDQQTSGFIRPLSADSLPTSRGAIYDVPLLVRLRVKAT